MNAFSQVRTTIEAQIWISSTRTTNIFKICPMCFQHAIKESVLPPFDVWCDNGLICLCMHSTWGPGDLGLHECVHDLRANVWMFGGLVVVVAGGGGGGQFKMNAHRKRLETTSLWTLWERKRKPEAQPAPDAAKRRTSRVTEVQNYCSPGGKDRRPHLFRGNAENPGAKKKVKNRRGFNQHGCIGQSRISQAMRISKLAKNVFVP